MSEEPDLPEDFNLIAAFNAGDEAAFTRLVDKHSTRLINFLYRYTRDRGAAEDLAQEAFLRLYRTAPALEPRAALSTVLFRFAYNLAVDSARRSSARSRTAAVSLDGRPSAGRNRSAAMRRKRTSSGPGWGKKRKRRWPPCRPGSTPTWNTSTPAAA